MQPYSLSKKKTYSIFLTLKETHSFFFTYFTRTNIKLLSTNLLTRTAHFKCE